MRGNSPSSYADAIRLEETASMPINRCDPYNVVYSSPFSNTVVIGVSNGVLFLTIRQEKPASSYQNELFTDVVSNKNGSRRSSPVSKASDHNLFCSSLQIVSAVEIDFQNADPIGRFRPAFINGLTEQQAEAFYYDYFLSQKPASRQQSVTLSRSLFRTSGAHVVKIFSALVNFDDPKTGKEVVIAITSTGGWYVFSCNNWVNSQLPVWQRIDSWQSVGSLLRRPLKVDVSEPSEVCESYLSSLHAEMCRDLTAAESSNGQLLLFIVTGLNRLLAYTVDILNCPQQVSKVSSTNVASKLPADSADTPSGKCLISKLMKLPGESKAVSCCYIAQSHTLAFGCEDGRIYLLRNISPHCPLEFSDVEISYENLQLIWPHSDILVDILQVVSPVPQTALAVSNPDSVILVAAKGSFLTAWVLPSETYACCHVDAFPIISVSACANSPRDCGYLARFVVCTQKAAFIVSLSQPASNNLQLSCYRILGVDEVSSPLGKRNEKSHPGTASTAAATNVVSTVNDSFRRRHLSTNQWLFVGFAGSPSLNFFIAATGIFCPCKASLLLAPSFSLKLFVRKKAKQMPEQKQTSSLFWDESLYELATSISTESDLIELANKIAITEGQEVNLLRYRFLMLQKACLAYSNGCLGVTAPSAVLAARNAVKRALIRTHLEWLAQKLLPVECESEQNIAKYHGYFHDLATMCSALSVEVPRRLTDLMTKFGEVSASSRQKCPVCETDLTTKLVEGDEICVKCVCLNSHMFRPCSKSLFAWLSSRVPILPAMCPICGEPTLRYRLPQEARAQSLLENCFSGLFRLPCVFCDSCTLP